MSYGQAFGAFGQGLSSGYQAGNRAQDIRRQREDEQPSAIDNLVQRVAARQSNGAVAEQEAITEEQNARTWDLIRAMNEDDYDEGGQASSASSSSSSGGGSQFNPDMIKQFTGSGSTAAGGSGGSLALGGAGGGLGGSGLMGSAGGAMSAGANGGASFGLGGSLVGGSGTVGGSTFAASAGGGAAGGGAAAGGGSAAGGLASAGPWAALAAIIGFNEENARKKGRRDEDTGKRVQDMITGKVLTQDIEGSYEPKLDKWTGGKASGWGFTGDMKGASQIGSFRFGKGLKTLWNDGTIGKIRDIF